MNWEFKSHLVSYLLFSFLFPELDALFLSPAPHLICIQCFVLVSVHPVVILGRTGWRLWWVKDTSRLNQKPTFALTEAFSFFIPFSCMSTTKNKKAERLSLLALTLVTFGVTLVGNLLLPLKSNTTTVISFHLSNISSAPHETSVCVCQKVYETKSRKRRRQVTIHDHSMQ